MSEPNPEAKIKQIYSKLNIPTEPVVTTVNTIVSMLSSKSEAGSLHVILGKAGSGCSTALKMCRRRLRRRFRNTVVLRSFPLDEEFNPWKLLLQYYGLHYNESDLKTKTTSVPRPVIDLIENAEIDCIIFDDFSDGLNKPGERQQAIEAWLALARHPACVTVIVTTHKPIDGKRLSGEEIATIHRINEWNDDEEFSSFISRLQEMLQDKFHIRVNLNDSRDQHFKLCHGNTGNLLDLIRECAVKELLSPSDTNFDATKHSSLKSTIKQNAFLFAAKSS